MNTLPAQGIKWRGVKAIELALKGGPVHIIKNNIPTCVVLSESQYAQLITSSLSPKPEKDTLLLKHDRGDLWLLAIRLKFGKYSVKGGVHFVLLQEKHVGLSEQLPPHYIGFAYCLQTRCVEDSRC